MKDFNSIYTEICKENNFVSPKSPLKIFKTFFKILLTLILILIFIFLLLTLIIDTQDFFGLLIALSPVIAAIYLFFNHKSKPRECNNFKNTVIASLVKKYDNNLEFNISGNIPSQIYNQGEFEKYDTYNAEDSITGKINGIIPFNMSNTLTQVINSDENGTSYVTKFSGLFAHVKLPKSTGMQLFIRNNTADKTFTKLLIEKNSRIKINMDSQEFEKYFDVITTDSVKTMQLLTADIMEKLLDFLKIATNKFDITIKNDNLYMRFHCGNVFEKKDSTDALDYTLLHTSFNYIDFACKISEAIYELVNESFI